jgi:hypothetical protein
MERSFGALLEHCMETSQPAIQQYFEGFKVLLLLKLACLENQWGLK